MKKSVLKQILLDQEAKTPVALVTELKTGRQDNLSELREDFTILSNAIIRLSNSNNNNKPE